MDFFLGISLSQEWIGDENICYIYSDKKRRRRSTSTTRENVQGVKKLNKQAKRKVLDVKE